MATIDTSLYDYPVTITSEEFEAATGRDLSAEIPGDSERKVTAFLNALHSEVYDFLIYNTGRADIKNRIIERYRKELEKPIRRALVLQGRYLLENGAIGLWNGTMNTAEGGVDVKDTQDVVQKILCPEAVNLLMATQPNILYAGG